MSLPYMFDETTPGLSRYIDLKWFKNGVNRNIEKNGTYAYFLPETCA